MSGWSGHGLLSAATAVLLATTPLACPAAHARDDVLNILTSCDHEDPELLRPFERDNAVQVHFRDIDTVDSVMSIIQQAQPGDWDLVVTDETVLMPMARSGMLTPLSASDFPTTGIPAAVADPRAGSYDNVLYAVPEKFGYFALAFDQARVSAQALSDINEIWKPQYQGRLAIYDSYLPGISYVALALGKDPSQLDETDLPALHDRLVALKANASIVGDMATTQQALADGQVDIVVGGGAWTTAGIGNDGMVQKGEPAPATPQDSDDDADDGPPPPPGAHPPATPPGNAATPAATPAAPSAAPAPQLAAHPTLTYLIPRQGALRWQQAISILSASQRKDMALRFARYLRTPQAQAHLATSSCYWGMPANMQTPLSPEIRAALHWDEQPAQIAATRLLPQLSPDMRQKLKSLWDSVIQAP
ncbi:ABC transporter substrate-binding protein [Novacetimonas cocois]|uniref:Spermidine/putrescine ABC transporter substrate-binding protein n=1 Tax=Novacetimonas cocois TaxID=1747507 RepID=A0A365YXY3_9PROT|nr:extracellular solute-binding protein [Novacetimonas cocois]RBM07707.1 spermidine/putrescine ABC transporter substrate-binding protein [Novacetimonas cocois]